ncbi:MAG: SIMPL domain-containing protein [Clostridia bacterium]|nr:SIMPL domain-containing protein [Clostridia bacterium]
MNDIRTLSVTGRAEAAVAPDLVNVELTLTRRGPDYEACVAASSADADSLTAAVLALGFDETDLKTRSYQVDTDYEDRQENGVWRRVFAGYRVTRELRLGFSLDAERLGRVLQALAESPVHPECRLSYAAINAEKIGEKLRAEAVRDAFEKAETLAHAAGLALGSVIRIDAHGGSGAPRKFAVNAMRAFDEAKISAGTPEDLTFSDSVDVTFTMVKPEAAEDFIALVKRSRSFRGYDESRKITREELISFVDCARFAPSSVNRQPFQYVLACEQADLDKIQPLTGWARALPDKRLPYPGKRPTAFIVIAQNTDWEPDTSRFLKDVGIVAQTMLLAAAAKGLGGIMIGNFSPEKLSAALDLPANLRPMLIVAFGRPDEKIVLTEVSPGGSLDYYRDENDVHYVPKRRLEDIIL